MVTFHHTLRHLASLSLFVVIAMCGATKPMKPTELVDAVCRKTNTIYSFCVESLYSDPQTPSADSYVLAYVSFGLAYLNASTTQRHLPCLLNDTHQLGTCRGDYNKAVSSLQLAYNDLDSETFFELVDLANVAADAADDCQAAWNTTSRYSPLTNMNHDLNGLCKICVVVSNLFT